MRRVVNLTCFILLMFLAFSTSAFPETYSEKDNKGILVIEDAAKSPRNFYENYHKSIRQHPNHLLIMAVLQRAQNAIQALKKLEASCNSGISQRDYVRALVETQLEVNRFVGISDADCFHKLRQSVVSTMQLYNNVNDYLELSELEAGISRQQGRELDADQIENKYRELIRLSLSDASQELATIFPPQY